jgi:hypothetical protein
MFLKGILWRGSPKVRAAYYDSYVSGSSKVDLTSVETHSDLTVLEVD